MIFYNSWKYSFYVNNKQITINGIKNIIKLTTLHINHSKVTKYIDKNGVGAWNPIITHGLKM